MNWHGQACGLHLVSLVGLAVKRGMGVLVAMLLVLTGGSAMADEAGGQSEPPRMAMGLIVKLKEARPPSVVRLKASAVPRDGAPRQRQRMFDAARRKRVSYLVNRGTAFGATVIHSGQPIPLAEAQAQAERLRADPDVEWVVVNEIVPEQAVYVPSGVLPSTASQSWLRSIASTNQPGFANIEPAWYKLTDGRPLTPVVVAILDSGILPDQALSGRYMAGYDFIYSALLANDGDGIDPDATDRGNGITAMDISGYPSIFNGQVNGCSNQVKASSWHGLEVAGVLAANLNGKAGMLAPLRGDTSAAVILPVRVAGKCGAEVSSIIEGLLWSANVPYQGAPSSTINPHPTARVINVSFAGVGSCSLSGNPREAGWLYANTIATLKSQGVLVVASVGNGNNVVGYGAPALPANCDGVLAATALNMRGYKAGYANLTPKGVAVAAGDFAHSAFLDDGIVTLGYDEFNDAYIMNMTAGTSFAAPQVAGVAAMMLAVNPSLSVDQLIQGIQDSSRAHVTSANLAGVAGGDQPQGVCGAGNSGRCYCTTATCGAGILDAARAVDWATAQIGHGDFTGPASTYASPDSYFKAPRSAAMNAGGGGGGGGGSLSWLELCGLASLTALAVMARRCRRPAAHQSRQAAKLLP